jgi:hypothetical protein
MNWFMTYTHEAHLIIGRLLLKSHLQYGRRFMGFYPPFSLYSSLPPSHD